MNQEQLKKLFESKEFESIIKVENIGEIKGCEFEDYPFIHYNETLDEYDEIPYNCKSTFCHFMDTMRAINNVYTTFVDGTEAILKKHENGEATKESE